MSRLDTFLFLVIPYLAIASFVLGHIWRYRRDGYTITARSTQLLERRWLRPGIILFHVGLLLVLAGHFVGILIPESATESLGLSEHAYHVMAVTSGMIAGSILVIGFVILLARRILIPQVRVTTTRWDWVAEGLLAVVIGLGMWATIAKNVVGGTYNYRETIAPWFRGIFTLNPDVSLVAGAPVLYQAHVVAAWLLLMVWSFTRLVHAWSVPVGYLVRSPILYRSRAAARSSDVIPNGRSSR